MNFDLFTKVEFEQVWGRGEETPLLLFNEEQTVGGVADMQLG